MISLSAKVNLCGTRQVHPCRLFIGIHASETRANLPWHSSISFLLLWVCFFVCANAFAAPQASPPSPSPQNSTNASVSSSAQVSLAPSTTAMTQVKGLFDHADYEDLSQTENSFQSLDF